MQGDLWQKQLLEEIHHEVVITMSGDSMEEVTGKIFQAMRKQIFLNIKGPIIQMEAEEVYFQQVDTKRRTEHFMFFFWPREKLTFTVTAKIVVKVKYLNITKEDL